jgi:putative redox protein
MSAEVRVLHLERYQHEATSRGHAVILDEPEEVGGDDAGLNPYELLLAALGGCVAITLRMYARRKGWDLQDVEVHLDHDSVHAADCASCETKEGKLSLIRRRLRFTGDLTDEQRARLREIAARCPVHRTLQGPLEIHDVDGD